MDPATLGITPIPGENSCGADVRYDPDFESVQAEIDKLSSPTASGQVDWGRVAQHAAVILNDKSKDLTIACYLSAAWICTRGIEGLEMGLQVLGDLVETYWDSLYPPKKRMRGRSAALQWWVERAQIELQKLNPPPLDAGQLERLRANFKRLDDSLGDYLPDAPILRPLLSRIEALPLKKGPSRGEPVSEPAAGVQATAPAAGESAGPAGFEKAPEDGLSGDIGNDADARRAADAAFQRLRQVSLFMIQHDLKNPLAFRYRRLACWARLTSLPVTAPDGNTQLMPPAPQVIEALDALREGGNLQAFVRGAEQKLSQFIFWFDLNRCVAQALNDLGGGYEKAQSAVCRETAALVDRLPGLIDLHFSDGMPFADAQTRAWLKSIRRNGASAVNDADAPPAGKKEASEDIIQQAKSLARKKNLVDAVGLLQQQMAGGASYREKMNWRLEIARLLLDARKAPQAIPHLQQMLKDIEAFQLDVWDPGLAVEGWRLAWLGLSSQNGSEHKAIAAELLLRIARIDPVAALRLVA